MGHLAQPSGELWRSAIDHLVAPLDLLLADGTDRAWADVEGTGERWLRAMMELTNGGGIDEARQHLQTTFDPAHAYDQLIVVRNVPFTSVCEHHLLPFTGTATLGYLPNESGRVVGLSKLPRALHAIARQAQIQERLTHDVLRAMVDALDPRGAGVVLCATHSCMTLRGACTPGEMVTSALHGTLLDHDAQRAEFLKMAGVA